MSDLNNVIVVDVETSGTSIQKHGLLSIGAVKLTDLRETFYIECRLDVDREIDEGALRVNGFTSAQCLDTSKCTELDAVKALYKWVDKFRTNNETLVLAGHNPCFDKDFLRRKKESWPFRKRLLDLHSLAFASFKESLCHPEICLKLGLPVEPDPHNGLSGAISEANCMHLLLGIK